MLVDSAGNLYGIFEMDPYLGLYRSKEFVYYKDVVDGGANHMLHSCASFRYIRDFEGANRIPADLDRDYFGVLYNHPGEALGAVYLGGSNPSSWDFYNNGGIEGCMVVKTGTDDYYFMPGAKGSRMGFDTNVLYHYYNNLPDYTIPDIYQQVKAMDSYRKGFTTGVVDLTGNDYSTFEWGTPYVTTGECTTRGNLGEFTDRYAVFTFSFAIGFFANSDENELDSIETEMNVKQIECDMTTYATGISGDMYPYHGSSHLYSPTNHTMRVFKVNERAYLITCTGYSFVKEGRRCPTDVATYSFPMFKIPPSILYHLGTSNCKYLISTQGFVFSHEAAYKEVRR